MATANDTVEKILKIHVDYGQALKKIAEYRQELEAVKQQQKDLKDQLKEGEITQEDYNVKMEASKMASSQLTSTIGVLTKQVKTQVAAQNAEDKSITQLKANITSLKSKYNELSEAERQGAQGQELVKQLSETSVSLRKAEQDTKGLSKSAGSLRQEMRELMLQLVQMKMAGEENSEEYRQLADKAGKFRDAMADVSQQINVYASDTAQLDTAKQGVQTLVNAYTLWKTASEALGIEDERLNKTMNGIMATMAALNALQQIQNALQSQSALMKGVHAAKTWILNTALGAQATATAAVASAEAGATTATWSWNASLYANPVLWVVAGIVALVAIIYGAIAAIESFIGVSKEDAQQLEEQRGALERLKEANDEYVESLKSRGATEEEIADAVIRKREEEYKRASEIYGDTWRLYGQNSDEAKESWEKCEEYHKAYQESLKDGLELMEKVQSDYHESEKKKSLGEYEYKRTLIRDMAEKQLKLAENLFDSNQITLEQYKQMMADIEAIRDRDISEVDKDENAEKAKKAEEASRKASDAKKKRQEEERKREEAYEKEFQAAQDSLVAILKAGLDKQMQVENLAYDRQMKALRKKLELYKTEAEYDVKMRKEINTQIENLTLAHEQRMRDYEFDDYQRKLKTQEEILNAKLSNIKVGAKAEVEMRLSVVDQQEQIEMSELKKRLQEQTITQEDYNALWIEMTKKYDSQRTVIQEESEMFMAELTHQALQNEIEQLNVAQTEREAKQKDGYQMSDQEYAQWREEGLAKMSDYDRQVLELQVQQAQSEYDAIVQQGQLSTETIDEFNQRKIAAEQKLADANKGVSDKIIANEQTVNEAKKKVTDSAIGMLNTLGQSNKTFAKLSKIVTLAQIAIDTGKALSAGIASASSMPFPTNIAAIATTVATILANVATAISTVKSAKFAQGGKVNGAGTGTSDSIPAMLSNGEYIVTANATRLFEPLLATMNKIGAGVPMQVVNSYSNISQVEMLTDSFESAAKEIKPVVSVVEITEAQDRVETLQNLDSY